jgi:hypothetical protein
MSVLLRGYRQVYVHLIFFCSSQFSLVPAVEGPIEVIASSEYKCDLDMGHALLMEGRRPLS